MNGLQRFLDFKEIGFDLLSFPDNFVCTFRFFLVFPYFCLRPFEGHSPLFDQVIDQRKMVDVFRGVKPVPLFILKRFDCFKLLFPEAQGRWGERKFCGHLANGIIKLL